MKIVPGENGWRHECSGQWEEAMRNYTLTSGWVFLLPGEKCPYCGKIMPEFPENLSGEKLQNAVALRRGWKPPRIERSKMGNVASNSFTEGIIYQKDPDADSDDGNYWIVYNVKDSDEQVPYSMFCWQRPDGYFVGSSSMLNWHEQMQDAWELMKEMDPDSYELYKNDTGCTVVLHFGEKGIQALGDTLPEAICRAYLYATEVENDE